MYFASLLLIFKLLCPKCTIALNFECPSHLYLGQNPDFYAQVTIPKCGVPDDLLLSLDPLLEMRRKQIKKGGDEDTSQNNRIGDAYALNTQYHIPTHQKQPLI